MFPATERIDMQYPQGLPRGGEDERPVGQITPEMTMATPRITRSRPVTRATSKLIYEYMVTSGETKERCSTRQGSKTERCQCGREFKTLRGMKIHQSKAGCGRQKPKEHRTEKSGETEEDQGQEAHHSAPDLQAPEESATTPEGTARKKKINWPALNNDKLWQDLDEELDKVLEMALVGPAEKKAEVLPTLVYSLCAERFGTEEKHREAPRPSRRQKKGEKIRIELKSLKKKWKRAKSEERPGLIALRRELRKNLTSIRKAERRNKERRKKIQARAKFIADPFKFTSQLLGGKTSGKLECPKERLENHLREVFRDERREEPLGECDLLEQQPLPSFSMNLKEPTWTEVTPIIKKARAKSAPGPSGLGYKIYKKCPRLLKRLLNIIKAIWRKGTVPSCWQLAEGCYVPKEEDSNELSQFRKISLLSVEGKIYFSLLSRRITEYLLNNKYIDISVQKGGIPGSSGCLEHTSMISQLLREAKEDKGDLSVVWLDLADAYGSVPHKLVDETLRQYHVPEKVRSILQQYYKGLNFRFSVGNYTTEWHRVEKGIPAGCTISVILFSAAMNLLMKAAEKECRGPQTRSGVRQPPGRAFMDDMTVTTKSAVGTRWILRGLESMLSWARMKCKPKKSRSLVVKRGKVTNTIRFEVQGEQIPTVSEQPVKCLGKWYDDTMKDVQNNRKTVRQTEKWLKQIENNLLPGKYKVWCYQFGLLPRLQWPMLVYDMPSSTAEELDRKVARYLRKWLGAPPGLASQALFSKSAKMPLPLSSVVEEYKTTKVRALMTLRSSRDPKIQEAKSEVRTGKKWAADKALEAAKGQCHHKKIVGTTTSGRQGLGYGKEDKRPKKHTERDRILQEVRNEEEVKRRAQAASQRKQGAWLNWDGVAARKISWQELWKKEQHLVKFLIRAVYDQLPTPSNLVTWGIKEDPNCYLCGERGNLRHILSGCPVSLAQGRYRWRHDTVLREVAAAIESERKKNKKDTGQGITFINFVQAEQKKQGGKAPAPGLLKSGGQWDIGRKLVFPQKIATTALRPDIVLWSERSRQVVMVELTVPWEERVEEAYHMKRNKYEELRLECVSKGWKCWVFPVEVGSRGFPAQSMWSTLSKLGLVGQTRKRAIQNIAQAAERASCWLWMKREEREWQPT